MLLNDVHGRGAARGQGKAKVAAKSQNLPVAEAARGYDSWIWPIAVAPFIGGFLGVVMGTPYDDP
jgi:hypothetical protein